MDIQFDLGQAYNTGYNQEIENRKRQAETERLLQQARQAQEMQPYEIEYKQAMSQILSVLIST